MPPKAAADAAESASNLTCLQPHDAFTIECLPDGLLGRVFATLGRRAGPAVTLVCRRWRGIFFAERAVWSELELARHSLHPAAAERRVRPWFASKRALLQHAGHRVQRFAYLEAIEKPRGVSIRPMDHRHEQCARIGTGLRLGSDVLACLSPAALTSLQLQLCMEMEADALAALQRLTALHELTLRREDAPLPPAMVGTLGSMRELRVLQLTAASLPAGVLEAAPQLQQLVLDAPSLPNGLVDGLHALTALTWLECRAHQLPSMQPLGALSTLRHLGWLERQREEGSVLRPLLQPLLQRLAGLQSWMIASTHGDGRGCMELDGVTLFSSSVTGCDQAAHSVRELSLVGVQGRPSLQQAVEAALPAGAQPTSLRSLSITCSELAEQPLVCPHLAHLDRLCLDSCRFVPEAALFVHGAVGAGALQAQPSQQVPALIGLLHNAPRVRDLALRSYFAAERPPDLWWEGLPLPELPPELPPEDLPIALLYSRGLRRLSLAGNKLHDLPAGPYLRALESLELDDNCFTSLPPALAGATALTSLSLRGNRQLKVTSADVADVLSGLLCLQELHNWECHANSDWAGLENTLSWLALIPLCQKMRDTIPCARGWPF